MLVALVAAFAGLTSTKLVDGQASRYVDDWATAGAALLATVACVRAARGQKGRMRVFWGLLGGACAAWTAGEAVWGWYDLVVGDVPAASWADAGYLTAIPLAAAGLLVHPALRGRAAGKTRSLVDGFVLAAALFLLAWTLIFEPMRRHLDLTSVGGLVTLAYPLGDVVVILLVVLVIRGTTGRDRRDLWCLLAGLLSITLADAIYAYLTHVQDYTSGQAVDTGWFAGYLAIALGAAHARRHPWTSRARSTRALAPAAVLAPFLPVLVALFFLAIRIELGHDLDRVTLIVAFVLVGLVLVRQLLLVVDVSAGPDRADGTVGDRLVAALGEAAPDDRPGRDAALRGGR